MQSADIKDRLIDNPDYHRPYGVHVGDAVWLWEKGAPPLSEDYVKPACKQAIVLSFRSGVPPEAPDSGYQVWLATLAYVDAPGSLKVLTDVPQVESSASRGDYRERSYGTWTSWHRQIIHASETANKVIIIDIGDPKQIDRLSESLRTALKRDGVKPFLYNETVRVALLGLGTTILSSDNY